MAMAGARVSERLSVVGPNVYGGVGAVDELSDVGLAGSGSQKNTANFSGRPEREYKIGGGGFCG